MEPGAARGAVGRNDLQVAEGGRIRHFVGVHLPLPTTIIPDPTRRFSTAGAGRVVPSARIGADLATIARSLTAYADLVLDAANDVVETLASYRKAVSLHLPVDLPGLIDGFVSARALFGEALDAFRSGEETFERLPDGADPLLRAVLDYRRRHAERSLSALLRTYDEAVMDLRDLQRIVSRPEYTAAFNADLDILERVLNDVWPDGVSVTATELSLTDASATLKITLGVPGALYADVPSSSAMIRRSLRDAGEAGCRLVGHLIIRLVVNDAA